MEDLEYIEPNLDGTWSMYEKSGAKTRAPPDTLIGMYGAKNLSRLIEKSYERGYISQQQANSMIAHILMMQIIKN